MLQQTPTVRRQAQTLVLAQEQLAAEVFLKLADAYGRLDGTRFSAFAAALIEPVWATAQKARS